MLVCVTVCAPVFLRGDMNPCTLNNYSLTSYFNTLPVRDYKGCFILVWPEKEHLKGGTCQHVHRTQTCMFKV